MYNYGHAYHQTNANVCCLLAHYDHLDLHAYGIATSLDQ